MTLSMQLRWKAPDSSTSVNLRFRDVIAKGFLPEAPSVPFVVPGLGAEIVPVPFVLQVTVSPFVLVNYDGAVVISDTAITPTPNVTSGQINYVVCRARYRLMDSPILQMQVLTQAAYLADPELPWLHVAGVVDLSSGGPYATVPLSRIFYEARDAIDEQTRSSWREPVATSGLLPRGPANHNRQGDVRLVTDTGSFYWWNEVADDWEVFDEVPVIVHRDYEHTNGITGDSAAGTLLPGVTGAGALSELTVAAVAAGSAYTVNGRLLQSPGAPYTSGTLGAFSSRGLIRLEIDDVGVLTPSYRAFSGTSNVDFARIVNMSDTHPAGAFSLLFTVIGSTLTWDNGPPVVVVVAPSGARRHRLYRPNGVDWIEIQVLTTPAAPGANISDAYTVNAPTDFETRFLVGYWFWDGSGVKPLIVGQDKRRFGNLGFPQMATEFKDTQFYPPETELRGNMVYSGGTCTSLAGLNLQILGPIVSYIRGKRFETAGFFNGTTLLNNQPNIYIYVDEQGVLQISITNPATVFDAAGRPLQFATVARVTTAGGVITVVDDERDPQLIVGAASRNVRVKLTPTDVLRYEVATKQAVLESNASTAGTKFKSGTAELTDGTLNMVAGAGGVVTGSGGSLNLATGVFNGPVGTINLTTGVYTGVDTLDGVLSDLDLNDAGSLKFRDPNTAGVYQSFTSVGIGSLANLQPSNTDPSIFSALRDGQLGQRFQQGVDTTVATSFQPSNGGGLVVSLAAGTFYDAFGRKVTTTVPTTVTITGVASGETYAIVWDPDSGNGAFASKRVSGLGLGADIQDTVFAIAKLSGTSSIAAIEDVRRACTGEFVRSYVTVGSTAGFSGANFTSIRQALLWIKCFKDDVAAGRPKIIYIITDITEPFRTADGGCIKIDAAFDKFWDESSDRLEGIRIIGLNSTIGEPQPQITYGGAGQQGFFIDFNYLVRNWTIENIRILYAGDALLTNEDICFFKDAPGGFTVRKVQLSGNNKLTHVCRWTGSTNFGGSNTSESSQGFLWDQVHCSNLGQGTEAGPTFAIGSLFHFLTAGTIRGIMEFRACYFNASSTQEYQYAFTSPTGAGADDLYVSLKDCIFEGCTTAIFNELDDAQKLMSRCRFGAAATSYAMGTGNTQPVQLSQCVFANSTGINLTGAIAVSDCIAKDACPVTGGTTTDLNNCDFHTDGTFSGPFHSISQCRVKVTATATAGLTMGTGSLLSISDTFLEKSNSSAQSNTILTIDASVVITLNNVYMAYTSTALSTEAAVVISASAPTVRFDHVICAPEGERDSMTSVINVGANALILDLVNCQFDAPNVMLELTRSVDNGYVGRISILDCNIEANDQVYFSSPAAAKLEFLSIERCRIFCTSNLVSSTPGCKKFVMRNNDITLSYSTNQSMVIGSDGTINSYGEISHNNLYLSGGGGFKFSLGDYYTSRYIGNTGYCDNTQAAGASSGISHLGTSGESCVVIGNDFMGDNDGTNAGSCSIQIGQGGDGPSTIIVIGNSVRSDGDSTADATSSINCSGGGSTVRQLVISNNTMISACSGTGNPSCTISAFTFDDGNTGTLVVNNNLMETDNGGSATATAQTTLTAGGAGALTVSNNVMRMRTSAGAGTSVCRIRVSACTTATIIGNSIRSSDDANIDVLATAAHAIIMGNALDSNGASTVTNASPSFVNVNNLLT